MAEYSPTWESLDSHPLPEWFQDAKLGIFIHWGVYSVPAWAPVDAEISGETASPYAEWYPYYMHEPESPTAAHHKETYGEDVEYVDFIDDFTAAEWDPKEWASLFEDVNAGYVVLTGEHHDGFALWDSHYTKYNAAEMGPERDLVGDLAGAVRDCGLRFAASYHANYNYYQPGYDGQFGHPDYQKGGPSEDKGGPGSEYVDFMNAKHRELIRKYNPDMLWFDVPKAEGEHLNALDLVADYYNHAADRGQEVAVNDRMSLDAIGPTIDTEGWDTIDTHGDFVTPEYVVFDNVRDEPWEANRGIGNSFGYNEVEDESDHLTKQELVQSFIDIVSKNGNLLINIGPKPDGTIPDIQYDRLKALGHWLDINGEAIFKSRPWIIAEDKASEANIRYTHRDKNLYAISLGWPGTEVALSIPKYVEREKPPQAVVLTEDGEVSVDVTATDGRYLVDLPDRPNHEHAYVIRFADVENPNSTE